MAENDRKASQGSFEERLARARKEGRKAEEREAAPPSPIGIAFRLSVEMVAGLAAGGIIGWILDQVLSTTPVLMILFLFFGFGAGMRSAMRAAKRMQEEAEDSEKNKTGR